MPWKKNDLVEQRYDLVRQMRLGELSVSELCHRTNVSRQTAYKWKKRYEKGRLRALMDRSRAAKRIVCRVDELWLDRLRRLRKKRPTWGARKLGYRLSRDFGKAGLPSVATMTRWLRRWGLAKGKRRRKPGPVILRAALRPARHSNEVWTVDFKGSYLIGDGTRVEPLTVRDLYSRYGLLVRLQRSQSVQETKKAFVKLFNRYGLPERIRSDNGIPFGGGGPTRLTRLSAWWVKLGIQVEFIAPGRPDQNGAHEQFHRVYKKEVAKEPTQTMAGQQRRSDRWLKDYNEERPHEAGKMKPPAERYKVSRKRRLRKTEPWSYPEGWERRWVKGSGEIGRHGKRRFIGEAFAGDYVGLKSKTAKVWQVYFGPLMIGELHENEPGNIRVAQYRRSE
jgi:putative transposase